MESTTLSVYTNADTQHEYEHDLVSSTLTSLGLLTKTTAEDASILVIILSQSNLEKVKQTVDQAFIQGKLVICLVKKTNQSKIGQKVKDYLDTLPSSQSSHKYKELGVVSEGVEYFEFTSLSELESALKRSLGHLLVRLANRQIMFIEDPRTMYSVGTEVVEKCRNQLIVVQQTPILFFGSRPYAKDVKDPAEDGYLKALEGWLEKCQQKNSNSRFLYFYDADLSSKELTEIEQEMGIDLRPSVKEKVTKLIEIQQKTEGRVVICPIERANALTIGDSWFGIWFMGKKAPLAYTYSDPVTSKRLAKRFERIAQTVAKDLSSEDILEQMGIAK